MLRIYELLLFVYAFLCEARSVFQLKINSCVLFVLDCCVDWGYSFCAHCLVCCSRRGFAGFFFVLVLLGPSDPPRGEMLAPVKKNAPRLMGFFLASAKLSQKRCHGA